MRRLRRAFSGFTLVELMVVVAVIGVFAAIAVPNMRTFIVSTKVKNLGLDLYADLAFARSEAIKRNATVSLEAVGGWTGGWKVSSGADVIKQREAISGSVVFSGPDSITFNSSGRPQGGDEFSLSVTSPELSDDYTARCVSVDLSGRPRSSKGPCP